MTDHLFAATLTFALLAGGTTAIGSELLGAGATTAPTTAAKASATTFATLPGVTVIGRRPASTAVATDTRSEPARRVQ